MKTEAQIQYEILSAWGAHPQLRLWRQNTGVAVLRGQAVRFGTPGTADILGIVAPSGRWLAIECKSAKGRQSPDQKKWQAMLERFGGLYVLARSLEDVDAALAELGISR